MSVILSAATFLPPFSPSWILAALLFISAFFFLRRPPKRKIRIPSPPTLPLIGNLHQLGPLAHRSMRTLSAKHGPVMLLYFGPIPTVVVSSPAAAEDVMKTNDHAFSSRPDTSLADRLFYGARDIALSKYGEYWRRVRRICVVHLLSPKRVHSFRFVRAEEASRLVSTVRCACAASSPVNVTELISAFTCDVLCRVLFGKKGEGGGRAELSLHTHVVEAVGGSFPMRDFSPWLAWLDWLSGLDAKVKKASSDFDAFVEKILKSDMFTAGTDTTNTTIDWAMAELIRHPKTMAKAQEEIRQIVGWKEEVGEETVQGMPYLKAVIKETLRLHPPAPILFPRESMEDARVLGYHVPKGTRMVVNAWAIGRDPASWEEAEEFRPERFLNSKSFDFKGLDFEFIPFGSGRRGCPGIDFAIVTTGLALATLLYHFDWELPEGVKEEEMDMTESPGFSLKRKSNLILISDQSVDLSRLRISYPVGLLT
ncbi:cytochrome P450 71A1-like isoform X2 [Zingiber officinale]|uniref:cytochrome P450 71A1-like isoform X2 n=1 Tax=Zingiber officinale TaxID=94328 RepID=UPI001C4C795B|nr:cytochrome P450 71A1-like isoform X2 [Zingiber officinale]